MLSWKTRSTSCVRSEPKKMTDTELLHLSHHPLLLYHLPLPSPTAPPHRSCTCEIGPFPCSSTRPAFSLVAPACSITTLEYRSLVRPNRNRASALSTSAMNWPFEAEESTHSSASVFGASMDAALEALSVPQLRFHVSKNLL